MYDRIITDELLDGYGRWLYEGEKSMGTIKKYLRYLRNFQKYLDGEAVNKDRVIAWKEELRIHFCVSTVNVALAAVNGFFKYYHWGEYTAKFVKVNRRIFWQEQQVLSAEEYKRLVRTALEIGDERMALLLQTVCSTGIRISELQYITAEAVEKGAAEVDCKGKVRTVFLTRRIRGLLKDYMIKYGIREGMIFVTRNGRPLDRSNIWRKMQWIGRCAGVETKKIFPHNLRHLFARSYYEQEKDLSRLADILGHSSINTTRIYTVESGCCHIRQMEKLDLFL